jgi:hypothetical protein
VPVDAGCARWLHSGVGEWTLPDFLRGREAGPAA